MRRAAVQAVSGNGWWWCWGKGPRRLRRSKCSCDEALLQRLRGAERSVARASSAGDMHDTRPEQPLFYTFENLAILGAGSTVALVLADIAYPILLNCRSTYRMTWRAWGWRGMVVLHRSLFHPALFSWR